MIKFVYNNSPVFLQNTFTTIKGFQMKKERYNKFYYRYYSNLKKQKINQQEELFNFLNFLKRDNPYYSEILKDVSIDEKNLMETFKKLPIINKTELKRNINEISNKNMGNIIWKTGGTTGAPLAVRLSKNDVAKRLAFLDYFKELNGVKPFSKRASFTSSPIIPRYKSKTKKVARYNRAINQLLFSGYILDEKNVHYYIKELNKFKPESLDGLTSAIYFIAKHIIKNNIQLEFRPIAIFPTAETLLPEHKKIIEKAFNTKVFNQYASSEGAPFIYENQERQLVVSNETGIFEFFKDETESNTYEMVVTSLINTATPLVRYKIGDAVKIDCDEPYINNYNKTIFVNEILGRSTEYLIGKDGKVISSVNIINSMRQSITQECRIQFIQNDISHIIVKVEEHYTKPEELIDLKDRLEEKSDIPVVIEESNDFIKSNVGKTRFIVNNLS